MGEKENEATTNTKPRKEMVSGVLVTKWGGGGANVRAPMVGACWGGQVGAETVDLVRGGGGGLGGR